MSYSVSIAWQVSNFFMSMGLGFFVGLSYDVISSLILAISQAKYSYIISDLIFSVFSTLIFFSYTLIYCQGITRLISIIACIIGGLVFHFTIGKIIGKLLNTMMRCVKKVFEIAFYPLIVVIKFIVSISIKLFKKLQLKINIKEKLKPKEEKTKKEAKNLNNLNKKILNFKKRLAKNEK